MIVSHARLKGPKRQYEAPYAFPRYMPPNARPPRYFMNFGNVGNVILGNHVVGPILVNVSGSGHLKH
jgi:hypothetical protein